jgi:hypothetical protein
MLPTRFMRGVSRHCAVTSGASESRAQQRFRLVGVGLSDFREPDEASEQPALFE